MHVDIDFHAGSNRADAAADLAAVIEQTQQGGRRLAGLPLDRILDVFDQYSERLLDRKCPLHARYAGYGIPYVAQWCRRANLQGIVDWAFGDRRLLDGFGESHARMGRQVSAFPRGLVVHWMAGNVPTLGFLSLIQGLLTKNANVVKVASDSDRFLADLLQILSEIEPDADDGGRALAEAATVVRFSREDKKTAAALSQHADIRVIWGDDTSAGQIRQLPAKLCTQDIVFPSKTSLILVSREVVEGDLQQLARRTAVDVSTFEQKACASPHTIFLETDDAGQITRFAESLHAALTGALKTYPKAAPSSTERSAVLNLRAEYDMFHKAWYSGGLEFTILSDDSFQIGPAIGNRTIFVRQVGRLEDVAELITSKVQTIGLAVDAGRIDDLTCLLGRHGVQRFTKVGAMTNFDLPWDGYVIPQQLVRWTSRAKMETEARPSKPGAAAGVV